MIRVVAFLVLAGLAAAAAVWLADRPGEVSILWLDRRIETSVMVAAVALLVLAALAIALWSLLRLMLRTPGLFRLAVRERRRRKGYEAISRGLIAVGAGDMRTALRFAENARRGAPSEPLTLLLLAQAAQLSGDRAGAEEAFRAMAGRTDTRLIGLRGLYVEAQRRDDVAAARRFAEEAAKAAPALAWAGQAVLEFRCAAGDWAGALAILEGNRKSGVLDKRTHRRLRAVLLAARALSVEESERDLARALVVEAAKLAPDLVPAAALAGRLLSENGELRKAGRILEAAWKAHPHPDLAEAYANLRLSDSARERLRRMQSLTRQPAGHVEGALAVARAALDAREFAVARTALGPLAKEPTQRVALLMAELEQGEHGDEGRAREWMARALHAARDPAWTADGFVSDHWLPLSPVTGRLDAFQWKVPVEEVVDERRIERAPARPLIEAQETQQQETQQEAQEAAREVTAPPLDARMPDAAAPAAAPAPVKPARPRPVRPEAVIPLIQVPDDPGPVSEPGTEVEFADDPKADGWQRIRQLFR
jgi:HemY protein